MCLHRADRWVCHELVVLAREPHLSSRAPGCRAPARPPRPRRPPAPRHRPQAAPPPWGPAASLPGESVVKPGIPSRSPPDPGTPGFWYPPEPAQPAASVSSTGAWVRGSSACSVCGTGSGLVMGTPAWDSTGVAPAPNPGSWLPPGPRTPKPSRSGAGGRHHRLSGPLSSWLCGGHGRKPGAPGVGVGAAALPRASRASKLSLMVPSSAAAPVGTRGGAQPLWGALGKPEGSSWSPPALGSPQHPQWGHGTSTASPSRAPRGARAPLSPLCPPPTPSPALSPPIAPFLPKSPPCPPLPLCPPSPSQPCSVPPNYPMSPLRPPLPPGSPTPLSPSPRPP